MAGHFSMLEVNSSIFKQNRFCLNFSIIIIIGTIPTEDCISIWCASLISANIFVVGSIITQILPESSNVLFRLHLCIRRIKIRSRIVPAQPAISIHVNRHGITRRICRRFYLVKVREGKSKACLIYSIVPIAVE